MIRKNFLIIAAILFSLSAQSIRPAVFYNEKLSELLEEQNDIKKEVEDAVDIFTDTSQQLKHATKTLTFTYKQLEHNPTGQKLLVYLTLAPIVILCSMALEQ